MPRWVRIVFLGLGVGLLGIAVATHVWASRRAAIASEWPQVQGLVLSSNVEERISTDTDSDGNRRTTRTLHPIVTYSYVVGGETYRSDTIWLIAQRGYGDMASADAIARRFPAGGRVAVHYDPADPADSALIPEGVP